MKKPVVQLLAAAALLAMPLAAQRGAQPRLRSAEVQSDRTIMFRLRAPNASAVSLNGDLVPKSQPMEKDSEGIWSVKVGPLDPAIYGYSFTVDGVRLADPNSGFLQAGVHGVSSLVEVPGPEPMFYDAQKGPHGAVHMRWYRSKALEMMRSVWVYTPPGYEKSRDRYPVLYLLHGSGDTEGGWVTIGRANFILDNLIAHHQAVPMVVVMPFGHPEPAAGLGLDAAAGDRELFTRDLMEDVMPLVESEYRIDGKPERRAIAGLSMGGGQSLRIGPAHLDRFRWIGVFSAGIREGSDTEPLLKESLKDADAINQKVKLFWIGCGKADPGYGGAQYLEDFLKEKGIRHVFVTSEGGHVWRNWRDYLHQMAPLLFQK
jgi:enterochelin esterase family protein